MEYPSPGYQQTLQSPSRVFYVFSRPVPPGGQPCPWCERTKTLLRRRGYRFSEVPAPDLSRLVFPDQVVVKVNREDTKYHSWPQIYFGEPNTKRYYYLGGFGQLEGLTNAGHL